MSTVIKNITLPIIHEGLQIEVPISVLNTLGNVLNYDIQIIVPNGVSYASASLPKGSYDAGSNTWNVGGVVEGELIQGIIYYTVDNPALAPFEFNINANGTTCECIKINGLTCRDISNCNTNGELARDFTLIGTAGNSTGPIDVTANVTPCNDQTYDWLNTAGGKLTGSPDAAIYTPGDDFYGVEIGEYAVYCNGILADTARVLLATSYAACTTQWVLSPTNTVYTGNVGVSDLPCTNGGTTTFHLKNAPTADGPVVYDTTSSDVKVTNWNQATGDYQATSINSFEGVVFFDYFIRCTINGQSWDSFPGQEVLSITAAFPFSSSIAASSSNVVSSSVVASSSMVISSSNAASSSAPASSSNTSSIVPASSSATSSIVPPSSSILIPSSNPAASSSISASSSNPTSSSINVSSGTPPSSSFAFLSSSNIASSSQDGDS